MRSAALWGGGLCGLPDGLCNTLVYACDTHELLWRSQARLPYVVSHEVRQLIGI